MNRSYSLNPVYPNVISNLRVFRKIEVQISRFYCIFLFVCGGGIGDEGGIYLRIFLRITSTIEVLFFSLTLFIRA